MALVLTVEEGRSFFVGGTEIVVEHIIHPEKYKLRVKGAIDNLVEVDFNGCEVLPDITISSGPSTGRAHLAKLVITAPRSVKILRDNLYYNV